MGLFHKAPFEERARLHRRAPWVVAMLLAAVIVSGPTQAAETAGTAGNAAIAGDAEIAGNTAIAGNAAISGGAEIAGNTAIAVAAAYDGAALAAAPGVDADAERYLFAQLNQARARHGRERVVRDPALDQVAREKATDMAVNGYFDHVSPTLGTVYDMLTARGMAYKWAGENIARVPSAQVAHEAFMESPDHRANILSAGYTHVGVGVVEARGRLYVAQVFMRPR